MPAGDKLEYKLAQQPVGLPKFSFLFMYEEVIKRIGVICVVGGLL